MNYDTFTHKKLVSDLREYLNMAVATSENNFIFQEAEKKAYCEGCKFIFNATLEALNIIVSEIESENREINDIENLNTQRAKIFALSKLIAEELKSMSNHETVEITSNSVKITEDVCGIPL